MSFRALVERLLDRSDLDEHEAGALLSGLVAADVPSELKIAALAALRTKGETAVELRGISRAMRDMAIAVEPPRDLPVVDTCGTGGDGRGSVNISTGAALVVAATGRARVAKHGNRSVSSKSGSADVLERLGIAITSTAESAAQRLADHGFAFLFAPAFHPAMAHLAPVRRAMGVRTVMNLVGPLTNPARPDRQLIGVFDERAARLVADSLVGAGIERAAVVTGLGFDEATPCGPFLRLLVHSGRVEEALVDPRDYGMARCVPEDLSGGSPEENAALLEAVLRGAHGPHRDAIVLNAAIVLELCDWPRGDAIRAAAHAIDAGRAGDLLDRLRATG